MFNPLAYIREFLTDEEDRPTWYRVETIKPI